MQQQQLAVVLISFASLSCESDSSFHPASVGRGFLHVLAFVEDWAHPVGLARSGESSAAGPDSRWAFAGAWSLVGAETGP